MVPNEMSASISVALLPAAFRLLPLLLDRCRLRVCVRGDAMLLFIAATSWLRLEVSMTG